MTDDDLPSLYRSADAKAEHQQDRYFRFQAIELISLIASAIGIELGWETDDYDLAALLGAVFVALALAMRLAARRKDHEGRWHRTRATAEEAKSLAWQYAVAGGRFSLDADGHSMDAPLRAALDRLVAAGDIDPPPAEQPQVTPWMTRSRASATAERQTLYLRHRLIDQQSYYRRRATKSGRSAQRWTTIVTLGEAAALVMAFAAGLRIIDPNWSGILAAVAAAALAWHQAKRYAFLAGSYRAAEQQVDDLVKRSKETTFDESGWSRFVAEAEDVFSREHGLWLSRHELE